MTTKPYREFWIMTTEEHNYIFSDPMYLVQNVDDWVIENTPHYHVIEISALDAANAEIKALREALDKVNDHGILHYRNCHYFRQLDAAECCCGQVDTEIAVEQALKESKERWK